MTVINQVGNALTSSTGTGAFVGANTPTLITPVIGAATGTSLVTSGAITTTGGQLTSGSASGGVVGAVVLFSNTASNGVLEMYATNSPSNFNALITNAPMGQTTTFTIVDPGSTTANFILNKGTQSIGTGLTLTAPVLGAASATSVAFTSTSGIIGTTTNDSAAAGSVGQYISSTVTAGSPTNITTSATAQDVTSISLTAGDWDVSGNIGFFPANTTVVHNAQGWVSSTSATFVSSELANIVNNGSATLIGQGNPFGFSVPTRRFSLSGTTTIYLSGSSFFGTSTITFYGRIFARRVR